MHSPNKQTGLSLMAMLALVLLVGFFVTIAYKTLPHYYTNHFLIHKALKKLATDHPNDLHRLSKRVVNAELQRFYQLNNVRGDATKSLDVQKLKDKTLINVNYEVRSPLFGNIDIVLRFNNQLDSSDVKACCASKPGSLVTKTQ